MAVLARKQTYRDDIRDPRWQRKRLNVMDRDHYTCQLCRSSSNYLNVHHLYYLPGHRIWEYENEALVTLCDDCHSFAHEELPKISGLIAMAVLAKGLDVVELDELISSL